MHFVYKIVDVDNKIIYVGNTSNISRRKSGHEHMRPEYRLFFFPVDSVEIGRRVERWFIHICRPIKNIRIPKNNPLFPKGFTSDDIKWREYDKDMLLRLWGDV